MTPQRMHELLDYDTSNGVITRKHLGTVLKPNMNGQVIVYDSSIKRSYTLKLNKIAYSMGYNEVIKKNHKVLHKNLLETDIRLCNLVLVTNVLFNKINEAYRNVSSWIKCVPHRHDAFTYTVQWLEQGKPKNKVIYDVTVAKRFERMLRLRYMKMLTKYCVFD